MAGDTRLIAGDRIGRAIKVVGDAVACVARLGRGRHPLCASFPPRGQLRVDVAQWRDDRGSAHPLSSGPADATVEVLDVIPRVAFLRQCVDPLGKLGILHTQYESGRTQPRQLLGLYLAADTPVGVVLFAQTLQRLARARKVVEVPARMACWMAVSMTAARSTALGFRVADDLTE